MAEKKLTYAGAQGALRAGGSVLWRSPAGQTHLISRVEDLPPETVWAVGNPEAEAAARRALDDQIARLLAQREALPAPASTTASGGETPASRRPGKPGKPGKPGPPSGAEGEGTPDDADGAADDADDADDAKGA